MSVYLVAWLPFMASPFTDDPKAMLMPGVNEAQAIENARASGAVQPTDLVRALRYLPRAYFS